MDNTTIRWLAIFHPVLFAFLLILLFIRLLSMVHFALFVFIPIFMYIFSPGWQKKQKFQSLASNLGIPPLAGKLDTVLYFSWLAKKIEIFSCWE